MATIKVRYLTTRPSKPGLPPRYFWQPGPSLVAEGWRAERVPLDWASITDPDALLAAAIARAEQLNTHLDAVRASAGASAQDKPQVPLHQRSMTDLLADYQASQDFAGLAASTQRGYRQCLALIQAWAGDAPVRAIQPARIQVFRAKMAHTPAMANATLRVLRLVLEWARRNGWVSSNAATRPGLVGAAPSGIIWPAAAVEAFVAAADAEGRHSVGTAVLLNSWLGQREGDVLRMPRSIYRQGQLMVRQSTTGAGVALPIDMVPHLKQRLAEELDRITQAAQQDRRATPMQIILSEQTNAPYLSDNFRHVFARIRARLGDAVFESDYLLPGRDMTAPDAFHVHAQELTFMNLRHTAATRLAEAGCTAELISAITGHELGSVTAILKRYMIRTASMARVAFQTRLDSEQNAADLLSFPSTKIKKSNGSLTAV